MKKNYNREYHKIYRNIHKDFYIEYQKQYRFDENGYRTRKFDRSMKISNWKYPLKRYPMKLLENETWNDIYDLFQSTEYCMGCGVSFINKRKCLDHCHKTGYVRGVLCCSCNHHRVDVFKDMF